MKRTHWSVNFEHPAKGPHHCGECRHFEAPHDCGLVRSPIAPADWCELFAAKRGSHYDHPRSRAVAA